MANVLFMRQGGIVAELYPSYRIQCEFGSFAEEAGLQYMSWCQPEYQHPDAPKGCSLNQGYVAGTVTWTSGLTTSRPFIHGENKIFSP